MKVYITQKLSSIAETLLKANKINYEVFPKDRPITKKELIKNAKDADAVISLLTDKIDKEVIDSLSNCKVIANFAVGYNNIDVQYANSKNIIVTNTPDTLTDSTADLAITLILACARRLFESEKFLRAGKYKTWKPELLLGYELKNKTLGIIGAGRIGQATAKRAASFGMEILYFNKSKKEKFEEELKAKKVSLNQLMKLSDFISVHLPLNLKTFHILNDKNLKLVKKNSIIVNTSRGEIIDEKALLNLLKKNKNYIAGLDVFENEPFINKKLLKYKNVVILPHIGSATIEARTAMAKLATENVISVLKFKKPLNPVMF
ncbi:MAG: D-glycerate dehydrogenase [Ignavibacteria bacterium GWB2_35_6b]|nr:MAG: D-glycerate dehydrogenase [Ignavibacteria bacterium GWB2_35_6b]